MSEPWAIVPLGEVLTERQEEPSAEGLANGEIRIVAKVGFGNGQIQLRSEANTKTKPCSRIKIVAWMFCGKEN